jgi:hypothetical protein
VGLILTERLSEEGDSDERVYGIKTELGYQSSALDLHSGTVIDRTGEEEKRYRGGWSVHKKKDSDPYDNSDCVALVHKGRETPWILYKVDISHLF